MIQIKSSDEDRRTFLVTINRAVNAMRTKNNCEKLSFCYCLVAVVDFVRHSRIWKFVHFPRNVSTHCAVSHPLTLGVVSEDRKWYVRLFNCMANNQLCKVYAKHWCLNMILFEFPLLGLEWLSAIARAHGARAPHPNQLSLRAMTISQIVLSR